jgi:Cu(I)/Ag(I) efflux system membrane protein CusA/SilA
VVFEDGTDLYWARTRVLEYLNQATDSLPDGVRPRLGPDATGVGWVYSYALVDRSGQHDLAQLRSLQDWFLKFELQTVPGVAEVATVGGMVRQYQVIANPEQLRAFDVSISKLADAIRKSNEEVGGSVIELAEAEYMIHTRGFLTSLEDIERIPVAVTKNNIPVLVRDLASVRVGPEMRRVVADLDGEGEITGGIVVMRYGENALTTIKAVKQKITELKHGLPNGVEIIETYDRSALIERAVDNLTDKLIQEFIVVAIVCLLFLFHLRSAFVAIVTLPLGILTAFIVMRWQGINANIMSLGGIAIAVGAMVDAAIVMIENAHKHIERWQQKNVDQSLSNEQRWELISKAACEVGPALFFSLLIITLSFLPVFTLQAQEGRLFSPLAFTKTYAMAAAAGLAVTLVPVLMGYFIRGRLPDENKNPISRWLIKSYQPVLQMMLNAPKLGMLLALVLLLSTLYPLTKLGSEFMPEMYEGDLMYMPTTLPGLSIGKAQQLLQQTDRLIASVPEVKQVFGKIGRADTATDPAPLTMIETLIQLKPGSEWREGMTLEKLIEELDNKVKFPGLTNAWLMPIKTRIDMLSTGIKTPVGVKVSGPDLEVIEKIGRDIEKQLMEVHGTVSAYSERITGGRYIEVVPDRDKAAHLGINIKVINDVIRVAVGGLHVTSTVEGLERYPVNIRFAREVRDDIEKLREIPLLTPTGMEVALGQVAEISIVDGPPVLKSENARLNGWTFVDIRGVDLGGYVQRAQEVIANNVKLPAGYSITWAGQYEYLLRAQEKLYQVIPITLMIIFLLLYLTFKRIAETLMVMLSLPFALIGGYWLMYLLGYHMSVASAIGFIALAGVAAEFGVIMLIYLNNVVNERIAQNKLNSSSDLRSAIIEGAVMRVRPKAMTVAVIITGLIPIMIGSGAGSEVMQRIAAPMVGGMVTAPLLSLFLIPAIYMLWIKKKFGLN